MFNLDESDYEYRCYLVWAVIGRLALATIFLAINVKGVMNIVTNQAPFILAWSLWAAMIFFGLICLGFYIVDKYSLEPWFKEHGWKISVGISALAICGIVAFILWECWNHFNNNPNFEQKLILLISVTACVIVIGTMLDIWLGWTKKIITKFCKKVNED